MGEETGIVLLGVEPENAMEALLARFVRVPRYCLERFSSLDIVLLKQRKVKIRMASGVGGMRGGIRVSCEALHGARKSVRCSYGFYSSLPLDTQSVEIIDFYKLARDAFDELASQVPLEFIDRLFERDVDVALYIMLPYRKTPLASLSIYKGGGVDLELVNPEFFLSPLSDASRLSVSIVKDESRVWPMKFRIEGILANIDVGEVSARLRALIKALIDFVRGVINQLDKIVTLAKVAAAIGYFPYSVFSKDDNGVNTYFKYITYEGMKAGKLNIYLLAPGYNHRLSLRLSQLAAFVHAVILSAPDPLNVLVTYLANNLDKLAASLL